MTATQIFDYVGEGTTGNRPVTPNIPSTSPINTLAFYYDITAAKLYFYDQNTSAWIEVPLTGGGGGGLTTTSETASFSATTNHRYLVDTTTAAVTATMPLAPSNGDIFAFADSTGQFATHNLTINWNGKNFQGSSSNTVLSINYSMLLVIYNGTQYIQIPA